MLLAISAVTLTAGNLRRDFFPAARQLTEAMDTIADWRAISAVGNRVGPLGATVTITVFSDYECPACAQFNLNLDVVRRTYPDDIAVIWRELPLPGHDAAVGAAGAALCAGAAGRFEPMHNLLFVAQDSLGKVPWNEFARRAGVVDTATFRACMASDATRASIARDVAAAATLHAIVTPTVLVNGLQYAGGPPDLARIVRHVRRHGT